MQLREKEWKIQNFRFEFIIVLGRGIEGDNLKGWSVCLTYVRLRFDFLEHIPGCPHLSTVGSDFRNTVTGVAPEYSGV